MYTTKDVNLNELEVSKINPRFVQVVLDEQTAINEIIKLEPIKMLSLVKNISKEVLPLPFYLVMQGKDYIVMDGNRRLTAMKILKDPSLIPDIEKYNELKDFCNENKTCLLPDTMPCVVYDKYDDSLLGVLERLHVTDDSKSDWTPLAQYRMSQRMGGNKHKWMKTLLYYFDDSEVDKMTVGHSDKFNRMFTAIANEKIKVFDDGHLDGDDIKNKLLSVFSLFKSKQLDTRSSKESYTDWAIKIFKKNDKPVIEIPEYNLFILSDKFYSGQVVDINSLNVEIKDKSNRKVSYSNSEVILKFLTTDGKENDICNTNIVGEVEAVVTYNSVSKKFKVNIVDTLDPEIIFVSDKFTIERGNTCDLTKLVARATNGYGEDVKSKIKIKSVDGYGKVEGNVFSDENPLGEYGFAYKFKDVTGSHYSKVVYIEVVDKVKTPITSAIVKNKLFSFEKNVVLNMGYEVGELVEEINKLNMDEYAAVIACSCRSIIELVFDQLVISRKVQFTKHLKDKLSEIKNKLINGELAPLIKKDGALLSFTREKNFILSLQVEEMNSVLNQCAHNSIALVNKNKIEELIRKELTHLLVICNEWLN